MTVSLEREVIKEHRWVAKNEVATMLGSHLALRVVAGLESLTRNQTVYCEDGKVIL